MRIIITGSDGFIGRNLGIRLRERGFTDVTGITEETSASDLERMLDAAEFVFHLAGVNRPSDHEAFVRGNVGFTESVCKWLTKAGRKAPVVFSSSIQAELDNPYGRSKRQAEEVLEGFSRDTGSPLHMYRLPNVFGKWSRPHYNSAVATFCHCLARGLPIAIHDPSSPLHLVYVDDVVDAFLAHLLDPGGSCGFHEVQPSYRTTVGEVAGLIGRFAEARGDLRTEPVGIGLARALYATFVSFLPPESFGYRVPVHADSRGEFVEMLKTGDSGQFSYFTAGPGITRGEHYHHSKTEKFLVVRGIAKFGFRHLVTGETLEIIASGGEGRIVETVPGWTHNVTNIGDGELVVMLWANEVFNLARPDTVFEKVIP